MNGGAMRQPTVTGTTIKTQTIEYTRLKNRMAVAFLTGALDGPTEPEPEYFEDDTPCPLGLYD